MWNWPQLQRMENGSVYWFITSDFGTVCMWKHQNNPCACRRGTIHSLLAFNDTKTDHWLINRLLHSFDSVKIKLADVQNWHLRLSDLKTLKGCFDELNSENQTSEVQGNALLVLTFLLTMQFRSWGHTLLEEACVLLLYMQLNSCRGSVMNQSFYFV